MRMQFCAFCDKWYPYEQRVMVSHCDSEKHRLKLSQFMKLPTTLGVSWRINIPDNRCEVCVAEKVAKQREADEFAAIFKSMNLATGRGISQANMAEDVLQGLGTLNLR